MDRDPLLLERSHPALRRPEKPQDAEAAARAMSAAVRVICHLYEIALYHGPLDAPLPIVFRPVG